jgi:fumarate hydratase class II
MGVAFGVIKKAAAIVNMETGLDARVGNAIVQAADEVRISKAGNLPRLS